MYEFVTGPLAWLSFAIFFIGLIVRIVLYIKGLDWKMDRVTYRENVSYGIKGALRSILFWLFPYGSHSWRNNPWFTLWVFVMHFGLLFTPIFLLGHNVLLKERWGISLWTLPEAVADGLTVIVIVSVLFLILRRIALPEVRLITTLYDYLLLAIAVAPFITGFLAYHRAPDYYSWLIAHILCGEIFLIAIPLTKLSHFILFFLSRAQLGMDYGIKRGGMKGKGLAW
jgi:nitrate reductase gamma subunit